MLKNVSSKLKPDYELLLFLDSKNEVFYIEKGDKGPKAGTWTMVYDEAVEINIQDFSLFAYFRYETIGSNYKSICSESLIGMYRQNEINFGCFYMV